MKQIISEIIAFRNERNWKENDRPDNLAKSIVIEASELLENFQWGMESMDIENVQEELADVLIYSLAMAHDMNFDVEKIIRDKLKKNAIKYPL
jgi:NTP pyrophosphatase (non-canonical NTP hydrolase)